MLRLSIGLACAASLLAGPIQVHPSGHYFVRDDAPLLLITSDHHYGAVINLDFDYEVFLDKLKSKGMNFTRIYPGAYISAKGKSIHVGNPNGPASGRQILPWARANVTGADPTLGERKFDLDKWDEAYFARIRDFCAQARRRGIVVEVCFFNGMYKERWPWQAMYSGNNIQGVGTASWDMVQSVTADPRLLAYQERYVAEITRRLNDFDNLLFHVCDEPNMSKQPAAVYAPWMSRLMDVFIATERKLPNKHLLGQTVSWAMRDNEADFSKDSRIQYIDTEYARGLIDLNNVYGRGKPVVYIESNLYPQEYKGDTLSAARVEAWEYMVGGGAGFMQLNGVYTARNPAGSGDVDAVLDMFAVLRGFMESFDYAAMKRDLSFIGDGVPPGARAAAMLQPGKQYAFYIHHSHGDRPGVSLRSYVVDPGSYRERFTFTFASGRYRAEWIEPSSGAVVGAETFTHPGGARTMTPPVAYAIDIALRMKAIR